MDGTETGLARRAATLTLAQVFARSAQVYADRLALVSEDQTFTYRELDMRSNALANALLKSGVRPGGRIAVLSETRPEFCELYVAVAKVGVTLVTLNIRLRPEELGRCLELAGPSMLFFSGSLASVGEGLRDWCPALTRWVCFDLGASAKAEDYESFRARGATSPLALDVDPEAIHNVLYTSGTTGLPKGAMISQRAAAMRGLRIAQYWNLRETDGFVGWLPLYHCGGDESLYATLLTGGCYATVPKVEPERLYRLIERHHLTWTLLLPGMITGFLENPDRVRHDLSSLRFTFGYANLLPPQLLEEATGLLQAPYYDAYGQTETSYLVAYGRVDPGQRATLRKQPTPFLDVAIVDPELRPLPVGEAGECIVRGPSLMSGYLEAPEATAEVFRGGWLHTGDVLVRNQDGSLTFADRLKYLIKTGGENVYPAEVEQVIARLEAVQEVCVLGVPDERWGETVKACVVLRPGASLEAERIVVWCRENLASYKKPKYIEFLRGDEIPRSATGTVVRNELALRPITPGQEVTQ
jgi:acyl-CoA synthetase (AMP-forming)/AMP-acid ligase II